MDDLETWRKKLKFRSWHRGTREIDLILGPFADKNLGNFGVDDLERYAALLEFSDPDIYNWVAGREEIPPESDPELIKLIRDSK